MSALPDDIATELLAYLRQAMAREAKRNGVEPKALDETLARSMLERAATVAKDWEGFLAANSRKKPTPLAILARELVQLYAEHTSVVPGRTRRALMLRSIAPKMLHLLASGAGLRDLMTGKPYSLAQANNALKETRDRINKRAGLKSAPAPVRFWDTEGRRRESARISALTYVIGYENAAGDPVSDDDPEGWPVFKGYEPVPDRDRRAAVLSTTAAKLLKQG